MRHLTEKAEAVVRDLGPAAAPAAVYPVATERTIPLRPSASGRPHPQSPGFPVDRQQPLFNRRCAMPRCLPALQSVQRGWNQFLRRVRQGRAGRRYGPGRGCWPRTTWRPRRPVRTCSWMCWPTRSSRRSRRCLVWGCCTRRGRALHRAVHGRRPNGFGHERRWRRDRRQLAWVSSGLGRGRARAPCPRRSRPLTVYGALVVMDVVAVAMSPEPAKVGAGMWIRVFIISGPWRGRLGRGQAPGAVAPDGPVVAIEHWRPDGWAA